MFHTVSRLSDFSNDDFFHSMSLIKHFLVTNTKSLGDTFCHSHSKKNSHKKRPHHSLHFSHETSLCGKFTQFSLTPHKYIGGCRAIRETLRTDLRKKHSCSWCTDRAQGNTHTTRRTSEKRACLCDLKFDRSGVRYRCVLGPRYKVFKPFYSKDLVCGLSRVPFYVSELCELCETRASNSKNQSFEL